MVGNWWEYLDAAKMQQKVPRFMGADEADDHAGIPRDANGAPIFFILPPDMRAKYDKRLARCERGWRTTGDPAFAVEALILTHLHRQPPLLWLTEAACSLATEQRSKGYITRAFNAAIRRMRYGAVRDAKRAGRTWGEAYERAAEVLAQTPAAAKSSTMEADYKRVKRDLKEGRSGFYAIPKMPNPDAFRVGDAAKRKRSRRG